MEGRQDVLLLLDVCLSVILCRHITKTRSHDLRVEGVESAQNVKPPEANCLWELELYK